MTPPVKSFKFGDEKRFLEGPHTKRSELGFVIRSGWEFLKGFRALNNVGPCITIFGSARITEGHPYYQLARSAGEAVARLGFTVLTGGGPGLMEAANRGAKDAGGKSIGCNIILPKEQSANPFVDLWITIRYFFVRKVLLFRYSYGFVVLPGGIGTLDELFEALTLIQTKKIESFPVVLMGTQYWKPLMEQLHQMVEEQTVHGEDLKLLLVTDSIDETVLHLEKHAIQAFKLIAAKF